MAGRLRPTCRSLALSGSMQMTRRIFVGTSNQMVLKACALQVGGVPAIPSQSPAQHLLSPLLNIPHEGSPRLQPRPSGMRPPVAQTTYRSRGWTLYEKGEELKTAGNYQIIGATCKYTSAELFQHCYVAHESASRGKNIACQHAAEEKDEGNEGSTLSSALSRCIAIAVTIVFCVFVVPVFPFLFAVVIPCAGHGPANNADWPCPALCRHPDEHGAPSWSPGPARRLGSPAPPWWDSDFR